MTQIWVFIKTIGDVFFVWLVWSISYLFFCSLGNIKDLNYERAVYVALTNLSGVACGYVYARYLRPK